MKKLIGCLLLFVSASTLAVEPLQLVEWLKTDEAKTESYYITQGTLLCPKVTTMKNLYNYLVKNNFSYDRALIKRSPCYPVNQHRYGRLLNVKGEFLELEYRRFDSDVILKHWTHYTLVAKWSEYTKRLVQN